MAVLAYHLVPERWRAATPLRAEQPLTQQRHVLARPMATLLAGWVVVQVLVPLRHFVIPGNVHWTNEGGRFAWHMLLRDRRAEKASVVTDTATGQLWVEDLDRHLTASSLGIASPGHDAAVRAL